ncbi:hypothetical protein [Pelagicoccus mobilis]|uniref:Uncharacterized protein n=1 Tax=Pelagicoccus mobilis TaxID=415221 RepID=A0A934RY13_9BACT|nr:hypothetical protein [Pelagicoccus mobilis]MBK1876916.1 hypothetical protein [Pelagicoccus mobilis]
MSDTIAGELSNGRFAPRRPGEPSSRERWQQPRQVRSYSYQQPAQTRRYSNSYVAPPVARPMTYAQPAYTPRQRFAPTRPSDARAKKGRSKRMTTATVKTAYNIYKGYHSIKQATATAQARTAEQLFVEAVEDTTSPPTVAKIITYPIKLVANVVVEVVRTVTVDLWKY